MGRGLSSQQRDILALAAAVNAARNAGEPRVATFAIDRPPTARSLRVVLSREDVDLFDELLYFVLGGFRPGGQEVISCRTRTIGGKTSRDFDVVTLRRIDRKYDTATMSRSRRVSLYRATGTLLRRGLLVVAPGVDDFKIRSWERDRVVPTADHIRAAEIGREFDDRPGSVSRGYYLTAAGLAAVGDRWQELDVVELVEHWETARSVR